MPTRKSTRFGSKDQLHAQVQHDKEEWRNIHNMGAEEAPSGVSFSSGNQKQPMFLTKEREKTIPQEKDDRDPINKDKKPEVGDELLAEYQ